MFIKALKKQCVSECLSLGNQEDSNAADWLSLQYDDKSRSITKHRNNRRSLIKSFPSEKAFHIGGYIVNWRASLTQAIWAISKLTLIGYLFITTESPIQSHATDMREEKIKKNNLIRV